MLLKEHIKQCQDLYNSYDEEYKSVMGEPTIEIDIFKAIPNTNYFKYCGFSHNVKITKSGDGVYDILTAFSSAYDS